MRWSIAFPIACALLLILSVASSALADLALFRVEQRWKGGSLYPRVHTPSYDGWAGMEQSYIQPGLTETAMGEYHYPPPEAVVAPGNPIGGAFTLPQSFLTFSDVGTLTPKTAWPGYTTTYYYIGYNGPGKFQPNFGSTASNLRLVFPTTMGNPTPNWGHGSPLTPTTTFDGRYDMSRSGSIHVAPGPRRFGGTFRLFFAPEAGWKQYIRYYSPALYSGYGYYLCFDDGMYDCTPNTFASEPGTTAIYLGVWWLLTEKGRAKATTPTTPDGVAPTPYGNASYLRRSQHYLNLIHPWTTGFARASIRTPYSWVNPRAQGYDTSFGGVDVTVPHYDVNVNLNKTLSTLTTTTQTYNQYLKGVTRVVSMVRPRLVWTFRVPLPSDPRPISNIWQTAWIWSLKVFFLSEPGEVLMLGAGIAALLGLARIPRR